MECSLSQLRTHTADDSCFLSRFAARKAGVASRITPLIAVLSRALGVRTTSSTRSRWFYVHPTRCAASPIEQPSIATSAEKSRRPSVSSPGIPAGVAALDSRTKSHAQMIRRSPDRCHRSPTRVASQWVERNEGGRHEPAPPPLVRTAERNDMSSPRL